MSDKDACIAIAAQIGEKAAEKRRIRSSYA
jgi:hypothetical protein